MRLYKVSFINDSITGNLCQVYVVAKSFDDAAEEVCFQDSSCGRKKPIVEKIEVIADTIGARKYDELGKFPKLFVARSYDEEAK